jgi:hypothetical protein
MAEVSLWRLNAMRAFYLLIFVERSVRVLPVLLSPDARLGPFDGVAYSFWGALALLAALGLRYPLQMVPVLLIQLVYKAIWLLAVALPRWADGARFDAAMTSFTWAMAVGVTLDLIVIPWGWVLAQYARRPGDPWRPRRKLVPGTDF